MGPEEEIKYKIHQGMTHEEYESFVKFRSNGNQHLEENGSVDCNPWTDSFVNMIQMFQVITEDWDFSKPFRIVIDYDPKQTRTIIHRYEPKADEL